MQLTEQQTNDLVALCEWLLQYDEDLPNRDGQITDDAVNIARNLLSLTQA